MQKTFLKFILIIFALSWGVFVFSPVISQAVELEKDILKTSAGNAGFDTSEKASGENALSENVGRLIRSISGFVGTVFFVLTVYAGILWMTASGNEERVTKARDILKMAVIGLVISISAYSITAFVVSFGNVATRDGQAQDTGSQESCLDGAKNKNLTEWVMSLGTLGIHNLVKAMQCK